MPFCVQSPANPLPPRVSVPPPTSSMTILMQACFQKKIKKRFCQLIVEHHAFLRAKPGKPFVTKSGRTSDYFINFGVFHSSGGIRSLAKFYAKAIHQWLAETNLLTNKNASSDATHLPSTEGKTAITLEGSHRRTTAENIPPNRVIIFGPAYKGIPLSVAIAMELSVILDSQTNLSPQDLESNRPSTTNSHKEEKLQVHEKLAVHYCFNRKESKKHGEGGDFIGPELCETDIVFITDDVLTAGTAMTETIKKTASDKKCAKKYFCVDRGQPDGERPTQREIRCRDIARKIFCSPTFTNRHPTTSQICSVKRHPSKKNR